MINPDSGARTLRDEGLAFIPIRVRVAPGLLGLIDSYLSVMARIKYMWTQGGIIVYAKYEQEAEQAMHNAVQFSLEAHDRTRRIKADIERQEAALNPKKGAKK